MSVFLSVDQLLALHAAQADRFGGASALRDRGALEAAAARPAATFDGEDLYADDAAKAAALMHSLVTGHPFTDGNKRTGAVAAELFLAINGWTLVESEEALYSVVLRVARGELACEALAIWFRQRLIPAEE